MKILTNNKNMMNIEKSKKNNWKGKSQKYIQELELLLDKIESIKDQEQRRDILMQMLKCDNELTLLSEQLFEEHYKQGYKDAKKERLRIMVKKISLGIIAGFISGLFAAGGGMIVVPSFIHIFKLDDREARATSVFAILPMVITSGLFYYNNNYIDWSIGIKCAIGGIVGGYIGSKLLKKVSSKILRITFTVFLLYVAIRMVL